jgi:hypothetical protein
MPCLTSMSAASGVSFANLEPANAPAGDPVKSPSDNPGQMENDDSHANWVQPSAFGHETSGSCRTGAKIGVVLAEFG